MSEHRTVFLMYHELEEPGRALCQSAPGYIRYVLLASQFRAQMQFIKSQGWRGGSVSEALSHRPEVIAVTFDDGSETDLLCAVPILQQCDFTATFFITTGFLEKRSYLSKPQLRELSGLGFEIGCHSMTHPYLTDLDDKGLHCEIADAKSELEQIISQPVEHFSCPGGRHNLRVMEIARRAGYRTVSTSRMRANSASTNRFSLGRVAVMRGTSPAAFAAICAGRNLKRQDLMVQLREGTRRLLGNSVYDRLRNAVLRQRSSR